MNYLLDTNAIAESVNRDPTPGIVRWLDEMKRVIMKKIRPQVRSGSLRPRKCQTFPIVSN
jgi:predicted nucleic acid-binding protein